ncbi:MAG: rhomboid family intramembrane serine protease [Anaerolineae bacterium]
MLPIGDDNPDRTGPPLATYGLIAINAVVFLLELGGGDPFVMRWAFVPARFLAGPLADAPTILSAMFMHAGWMHLLGNMLYLYIFGDNIETRFGVGPFLAFYLVCGVAATFAQLAVDPGSSIPNLGASGAIAGVLGAYILLFPHGRVRVLARGGIIALPALWVIGFWFVLQLLSGAGSLAETTSTGGVAYLAHIGGFVAGLALAFVYQGLRPRAS